MTAQRSLFRRLIPSPMLSIMVVAFWLLMSDSFTLGQIVLGLLLGVVVPLFAARLDREFARIGTLRPLPKLLCVTLWDILMSNIRVAIQVLGPEKNIHPGFIWLPLDIARRGSRKEKREETGPQRALFYPCMNTTSYGGGQQ